MLQTATPSPRPLALAAVASLLLASPAARAADLVLASMDDVTAAAAYDPASRTYRVEASRIVVAGDVRLPLEGTTPANLTCVATDEVVVEAAGALRADGGDALASTVTAGAGGTIAISAPRVTVHGAVTAKGGVKSYGSSSASAGFGGVLIVEAGALAVDGTVAANGGTATGFYYDLSGMGGTVRLSADEIDAVGAITANAGYSSGWSYHGGTLDIAARAGARLGGVVAANGADGMFYYGGNGGQVTVTGGSVVVSGPVSASAGNARQPSMQGGVGGAVRFQVADLDLSAGMLTANGGSAGGVTFSAGGQISVASGRITPADEPVVRAHVEADPGGTITFDVPDVTPPSIAVTSPVAAAYPHQATLTIEFSATDDRSAGVSVSATLDGAPVQSGQTLDLLRLALGAHTLLVTASDDAGNPAQAAVTFTVFPTLDGLAALTQAAYAQQLITKASTYTSLTSKISTARARVAAGDVAGATASIGDYVKLVAAQRGKSIAPAAADQLTAEANALIASGVR